MTDHDVKIVVFTGFLSVVPARAGVIPILSLFSQIILSGPRASGGDPDQTGRDRRHQEWSPRERG